MSLSVCSESRFQHRACRPWQKRGLFVGGLEWLSPHRWYSPCVWTCRCSQPDHGKACPLLGIDSATGEQPAVPFAHSHCLWPVQHGCFAPWHATKSQQNLPWHSFISSLPFKSNRSCNHIWVAHLQNCRLPKVEPVWSDLPVQDPAEWGLKPNLKPLGTTVISLI